MKIQVNYILICIILGFLISGCTTTKTVYVPVETTIPFKLCHTQDELKPIKLKKLDPTQHVGSLKNEDIKMKNFSVLIRENTLLKERLRCYDVQYLNIINNKTEK